MQYPASYHTSRIVNYPEDRILFGNRQPSPIVSSLLEKFPTASQPTVGYDFHVVTYDRVFQIFSMSNGDIRGFMPLKTAKTYNHEFGTNFLAVGHLMDDFLVFQVYVNPLSEDRDDKVDEAIKEFSRLLKIYHDDKNGHSFLEL